MQKKIEIQDLDIPRDDIECWDRYPKHRWVYDMSRLLDAQNIKWSPFSSDALPMMVANMYLKSNLGLPYTSAYIYIEQPAGKHVLSEVYITKGEIKYLRHADNYTKKIITDDLGDVELRISAFVSIHFQKFTGVISIESIGNDIYSIILRPVPELALVANTDIAKLIKRIYKKTDLIHVTGLTDQSLREAIAS